MKDIETKEDIKLLVDTFYKNVLNDTAITHFFTDVVKLDFEKHLPKMYAFWETTLFHTAGYKGNPMQVHKNINQKAPLEKEHFDTWISLFKNTVDDLFEGAIAEQAKQRAQSIALVMHMKVSGEGQGLL